MAKYFYGFVALLLVAGCGMSESERINLAKVTCSVMGESRNMDSAFRVKEINAAREKLGGEVYLRGDSGIKESLEHGLCVELVLDNVAYPELLADAIITAAADRMMAAADERRLAEERNKKARKAREEEEARKRTAAAKLAEERWQKAKEARLAEEKLAQERKIVADQKAKEARLAAEEKAKKERLAAEAQRLADSKPTIVETFHSNGELASVKHYQAKIDGGNEHGVSRSFHENGDLFSELNWVNGKKEGLHKYFYQDDWIETNWVNGKREGLRITYDKEGIKEMTQFANDQLHGLSYSRSGRISYYTTCYYRGKSVKRNFMVSKKVRTTGQIEDDYCKKYWPKD
ncbi:hypothetical protein OAR36_06775 [Pseudomonadales bacterium]|nr:hypothetical protein [Pseudomonadales bacterium]